MLAVMAACAERMKISGAPRYAVRVEEARAAVVSLAEWSGVAEKFLSSLTTGTDLEVEAWTIAESLRAALANVGGAK